MDTFHEDLLVTHNIIKLHGDINKETTSRLNHLFALAKQKNISALTIEIASIGGFTLEAGKIFDLISNFPGTVTGLVRTYAYSAAANILQACHIRQATGNSQLLFHHGRGAYISLKNFNRDIKEITQQIENFDLITIQRSKLSKIQLEKLNSLDMPIFSQQALQFGLIDQIIQDFPKNPKAKKPLDTKEYELTLAWDYSELNKFVEFLDRMKIEKFPPLEIRIRSGAVSKDMVLMYYDLLNQYPGHITTFGTTFLSSISSVLMLAGDKRKMSHNTKFKLEESGLSWRFTQFPDLQSSLGRKLFKEQLQYQDSYIEQQYTTRSRLTPRQYRQMQNMETPYTSQTALKLGIIDKIIMPKHLKKKR